MIHEARARNDRPRGGSPRPPRAVRPGLVLGVVALAAGVLPGLTAGGAPARAAQFRPGGPRQVAAATATPCGRRASAPARYDHVVWITFENQGYASVIGNAGLPYLNSLARNCGTATQFYAEREPSLPNYIAMASGGTQGITDDRSPSSHPLGADNIYHQVKRSGRQWRHYASKMPSNCDRSDWPSSSAAYYTVHHEAAPYFTDIAADCRRWMVPLGSVSSGRLATDLRTNRFPAFAVIGPADDGGKGGGEVDPCCLDSFLGRWLPLIFASDGYRSGRTAIFITWDENGVFDNSATPEHVATVIVSASVRSGSRSGTRFTHYSMLRTTEDLLGISRHLGRAASAASMRRPFRL